MGSFSDVLLREIVTRVRQVGDPLKIILFGSHARGTPREDSDLDLLIIERSHVPAWERSPRYYRVLRGIHPRKDIVVRTPEEIDAWSAVPEAFLTTAVREGRVIYERTG